MNHNERLITRLLREAANAYRLYGVVFTTTKMELAAQGYELDALEEDVANLITEI